MSKRALPPLLALATLSCGEATDQSADDAPGAGVDLDGDGYSAAPRPLAASDGDAWKNGDCDDADPSIFPGADEVPYDGIDQDCSGSDLVDVDRDGHAAVPVGGHDCDDTRADVSPAQVDVCGDGVDQDCQGGDQECSPTDEDEDGVSPANGDCNDDDARIYPGNTETVYNGIDDDCDPATPDDDLDADGWFKVGHGDCDDDDDTVFPGADEIPYDGIDQNCSGLDLIDLDHDGHPGGPGGDDCDDGAFGVHPGAKEICNGLDDDCDRFVDEAFACGATDLLVSSAFSDEVYRFDAYSGAFIETFASGPDLDWPRGIAVGPGGHVFVTSRLNRSVVRLHGETGAILDSVFVDTAPYTPSGLAFDADWNMYLGNETVAGEVLIVDGYTGAHLVPFTSGNATGKALAPVLGPDGNWYVSDQPKDSIFRYDPDGDFIDTFASIPAGEWPQEPAFDEDGTMYVAAWLAPNIYAFASDGTPLGVFASDPALINLVGLRFGPDANLYAAAGGTDAIYRIDGETGEVLGIFASTPGLDSPSYFTFR